MHGGILKDFQFNWEILVIIKWAGGRKIEISKPDNNFIAFLANTAITLCVYKWEDWSWGQSKGSFSIATTLKCRGGCYSFPWIAPLTPDPHLVMLSVKQSGIKYHFLSLNLGLNPGLPDPWQTL